MSDADSQRDLLENDVREFLYTRLDSEWKSGKWSLDELSKFLEQLAKTPANINHLAIIYHLFRAGGAEGFFLEELPAEINRLLHATRRERNFGRRIGRGHIRWSETMSRQHAYSDPTLFCVDQAIKEFDTPANRLLSHYIHEIWDALVGIKTSNRGRIAARSEIVIQTAQEALRTAYLRQARSVTSISSSTLRTAERSKARIYWRAAELWQEFERTRDARDVGLLREILSVGWLAPLSEDDLFEIYVLVQVLRVLENMLCAGNPDRAQYRVMAVGDGAIGTFDGGEWVAKVYFDSAPHNTFSSIFKIADYKYKNILARYSSVMSARRPDICVMLSRKSDEFALPLIVEVKNTPLDTQYGRDSVYKMLGYLSDFEELWSGDRSASRPKAALVLREGVIADDYSASLKEELLLMSRPNLSARLKDFFTAGIASVAQSVV
ncbi:MAG: hypothetical protein JWO19_6070 [Bryobacterales bacterium]|nr:hypothetical protein [Bryobacterales bacterium]